MKTSMQHRVKTARALSDRQAERELCKALANFDIENVAIGGAAMALHGFVQLSP
jgi:hypothetical protein